MTRRCVCPHGLGPVREAANQSGSRAWVQRGCGALAATSAMCGTHPCPRSEPRDETRDSWHKQLALSPRLAAGEPHVTSERGGRTIPRSWEHFQPPEVPQQLPACPSPGDGAPSPGEGRVDMGRIWGLAEVEEGGNRARGAGGSAPGSEALLGACPSALRPQSHAPASLHCFLVGAIAPFHRRVN